ncbi:30S ribosomal protein S15 [Candidatus Woesearchaeota archaeon]|nr:30S ribosomal protein S15 [Candidatus Woesearchaeota archaeon]
MARMHSGAKGKSASKKPHDKTAYSWLSYKPKEVELLVIKMAKEGKSPSQIGLTLRDAYGIPDIRKLLKKKISSVLKSKKLLAELPEDLLSLIKKDVAINKHLESNKQDKAALRGKQLTESKIKRLAKYYKKTGRLPEDWKYNPKQAKMFVE